MKSIQNALISVSDKSGIVDFASFLSQRGINLYSTGGTAKILKEAGLEVHQISDLTQFPEIMDSRVKTLHPRVFGGILADRQKPDHLQQAKTLQIPCFDWVVVNLYPFAETIAKPRVEIREAIENIDIGGVALIRAAAKNYEHVIVITSPDQYPTIQNEMETHHGQVSPGMRFSLAVSAFALTASYDALIHHFFLSRSENSETFPEKYILPLEKRYDLRYGENPHQKAALYRNMLSQATGIVDAQQLHGKALSFNNLMDADAAFQIVRRFSHPAVAILKHANPCGAAIAETLSQAYERALETDRLSAFGGIVGLNRELDAETAEKIVEIFTEVVVAPSYKPDALEILMVKKNLRLLQVDALMNTIHPENEFRHLTGGILIQDKDLRLDDDTTFEVVSNRQPSDREWQDLLFGWQVVRWIKSNAIVYVKNRQTIGIGAGQMSRVDASLLAVDKARRAGLDLRGTAVASDAFFPFPDGVEVAAKAGASAVIQPGGSIRDQEVISAANQHHLAMVFTHVRHFRH